MGVVVVQESMFGNTAEVARAVADGLAEGGVDARVVPVGEAPTAFGADVTAVLVGGPTHAFSMSRESTRADAAKQGATGRPEMGIREWIGALEPRPRLPIVTFDTRVKVRLLPGSAAHAAVSALKAAGFGAAEQGETFWVEGKAGPMRDGELDRARAWGRSLATRFGGAGA
jgi:hypothetical protein